LFLDGLVQLLKEQFAKPPVQAEGRLVDFLVVFDEADFATFFRHEPRIEPEGTRGNTVKGKCVPVAFGYESGGLEDVPA
jgi:hypothetical protein